MIKLKELTEDTIQEFKKCYFSDEKKINLTKLFMTESISDVAFDATRANQHKFEFSIDIPTMNAVSQGAAGRCWITAGLNLLREIAARKMCKHGKEAVELEFSLAYIAFWDKMEKANCFLEKIIQNMDKSYDDKHVRSWFSCGITDGGFWTNFSDLVKKYGLLPKEVMPETAQSSNTEVMNNRLNYYIRKIGADIRNAYLQKQSFDEINHMKEQALNHIFSFLCECYSCPVEEFEYQYIDSNGRSKTSKYTPHSFRDELIDGYLDVLTPVISLPYEHLPYGEYCEIKDIYKVINMHNEIFLNLSMDVMKNLCIEQLKNGVPIVCVADDDKMLSDELQLWDDSSFDYKNTIGFTFDMSRKDYFQLKAGNASHSMLITGVNINKEGLPDRWKIENSYDIEGLHKGYFSCSDTWFEKYMVSVVIENQYLQEYKKAENDKLNTLDLADIL